jgi:hypothetical protein
VSSRAALLVMLGASGCGIPLLPTTLFYAPLSPSGEPDAAAWAALLGAAPGASDDDATRTASVVAAERLGEGEWLAWTATRAADPSRVEGTLVLARETARGLEAQAIGTHIGPAVRVRLRSVRVEDVRLVLVESSAAPRSVERSAWVYVVRGGAIEAADLDRRESFLPIHRDTSTPIDAHWDRARTVSATLEGIAGALVIHEHATSREIARDRPELAARAVREIDRDRRLVVDGRALVADRPSLFDEP